MADPIVLEINEPTPILLQKLEYNGPGPQGLSAYQVALANGYVGTEAQWLDSLQGDQGEPGAGITWQGAWSNVTNYVEFDAVQHLGSSWIANASNVGKTPGTDPEWDLWVEKGDVGTTGAAGAAGADGNDGADGADGNTILYGTVVPTTEGVDGDFYIRTTTNYIYGPKAAGTWPAGTPLVGPQGATGAPGATGATGAAGAAGNDGADGADGNTILYGTAVPTTEGVDGDFYIRTTTNYIYGPKAAGTWPAGTSLVGPQGATGATGAAGADGNDGADGADGNTILYGTVVPTTEGVDGDFYIRTTTNYIYGPKAAGTWPAGTSLVGPQGATGATGAAGAAGAAGADGNDGADGADGNTILYGTAVPTTEGVDGDFYIRTTTSYIYGPKAAGTWPAGTSLVGATGATGATGAAGAAGQGVPTGGTAGQVLSKIDGTDYNTQWVAAGGGVTYWTEAYNSGTQASSSWTATGAGSNINYVGAPKGSGAFLGSIPDGTAAGGNSRGIYAVDLQLARSAANQVASAAYSVIGGGYANRLGSQYGFAVGTSNAGSVNGGYYAILMGNANVTADYIDGPIAIGRQIYIYSNYGAGIGVAHALTGRAAFAAGDTNTTGADYASAPGGYRGNAALYGQQVHASGYFSSAGDAQGHSLIFRATVTGTGIAELYLDGASTRAILPSTNSSWQGFLNIKASTNTVGNGTGTVNHVAGTLYFVTITRTGSTTVLVGTAQELTTMNASASMTDSVFTVDANDTNEALRVQFTPPASTAGSTSVYRVVAEFSGIQTKL